MKISLSHLLAFVLGPLTLRAGEIKLPALFSDHVVLQRDAPVPVWGWADPDEEISVEFSGQRKTAKAGADGKWMVKLDPLAVNAEPHDLKIGGRVIHDVLVGDVWLCSGQSNMGMQVRDVTDGGKEVAEAKFPAIRLYTVAQNPALVPATDVKGQWNTCSPETVSTFSAAAYFFGRELQRELKIPIGLLHSSVGGTPAEAWTRLDALKTVPALAGRADLEIAQIQAQEEENKDFTARRDAKTA